jgi:hypothetical protein
MMRPEPGAGEPADAAQVPARQADAAQEEPAGRADRSFGKSDETGAITALGSARREPVGREPVGGVADWLLVAFITLLCAWTALVGVAYLPWYVGPVPLPVSALLGVGAMILAPRACYRLTGSFVAALLPVASWFVVTVWLVLLRNPMMTSQAVTVIQGQWRVMLLLGFGSLAAAATLTLLWAERARARYVAEGVAAPPAVDE